jgi:cytochrome c peroxidase
MRTQRKTFRAGALAVVLAGMGCGSPEGPPADVTAGLRPIHAPPTGGRSSSSAVVANRFGFSRTMTADGTPLKDPGNPFFQSLGRNGRSCSNCHVPEAGMSITPEFVRGRFAQTEGMDPIFRTNDGSTSPLADVSTVENRRRAFGLLLDRGLIRVGLGVPANAEFELISVDDPYGFASASELSLFRRPLAVTNLRFLSTVMWDGRETFRDPSSPNGFAALHFDLADQANSATLGHAQAARPLTRAEQEAIISFEMQVHTAQAWDHRAGALFLGGAQGGPKNLVTQEFYWGINDPLGADPTRRPFDPTVFTLYDAWQSSVPSGGGQEGAVARAAIARGQDLFNHRALSIVGVSGLNDELGVASIPATCTTCHDTPNAGNHSVPAPLRIGVDAPEPVGGLNVSGLPIYTLRNRTTGEVQRTTDPGRALVTGKWKDVGRFKGPTLRGVAARAPYFHNGSAAGLEDVIAFYDARFQMGLTDQEKSDLLAFLASL